MHALSLAIMLWCLGASKLMLNTMLLEIDYKGIACKFTPFITLVDTNFSIKLTLDLRMKLLKTSKKSDLCQRGMSHIKLV